MSCCTITDSESNFMQLKELENDHSSSLLLLKPLPKLELLVNQFNNATPENNNGPGKISLSEYYDVDEMHNIKIPQKKINHYPYSHINHIL